MFMSGPTTGNPSTRNPWKLLTAAPHRMFFFTGMWQLVVVSVWWALVLGGRSLGWSAFEPVLPGVFAHGSLVLYLMFTPFMAGFLYTVFSRWQPAPEIPRVVQLLTFAFMNLGQIGFLLGMYISPLIVTAALVSLILAWTTLIGALVSALLQTRHHVPHAVTVLAGLVGGFAGMLLLLYSVLNADWSQWPLIRALGIFAFLLPVYFSVSHRMVPFFTSRVVPGYDSYRPDVLLYVAVSLSIARAVLELLPEWRWLASVPLALVLAWLGWKWWPRVHHGHALMSVLHLSLLWLSGGVALYAAQDAMHSMGMANALGRIPLHALGIGFFGGMLISMVTRVSLGHSGRPLVLDRFTWFVFALVQVGVGLRIAGDLVVSGYYTEFMAAAALVWLGAFFAWAWKFLRIYWQPRVDGAPG